MFSWREQNSGSVFDLNRWKANYTNFLQLIICGQLQRHKFGYVPTHRLCLVLCIISGGWLRGPRWIGSGFNGEKERWMVRASWCANHDDISTSSEIRELRFIIRFLLLKKGEQAGWSGTWQENRLSSSQIRSLPPSRLVFNWAVIGNLQLFSSALRFADCLWSVAELEDYYSSMNAW